MTSEQLSNWLEIVGAGAAAAADGDTRTAAFAAAAAQNVVVQHKIGALLAIITEAVADLPADHPAVRSYREWCDDFLGEAAILRDLQARLDDAGGAPT